ncbi:UNVERIFIED_CONTAM: DEAD-box ATP-dependent RNA helicase 3, chloroplastic [Sesamum calycinum]|uniref:DEAD-box ATP-dependent RNA helicase 3, chloroplastic n=1 Tax=Sesamum calycinum TaxID=2727403 RepID=A0AAW2KM44_9LAMI
MVSADSLSPPVKLISRKFDNFLSTAFASTLQVYSKGGKTIGFTQTKWDADEVWQGNFRVLVDTDVAAWGLDILNADLDRSFPLFPMLSTLSISAIFCSDCALFELAGVVGVFEDICASFRPNGSAEKDGTAVLMFTSSQRRTVKSLERGVGCKIEFISPPSVQESFGIDALAAALVSLSGFSQPPSSRSLITHEQVVPCELPNNPEIFASFRRNRMCRKRSVHPESVEYFTPPAEKRFEQQGVDALAAALATLSGFSEPPSSRSLIIHEQHCPLFHGSIAQATVLNSSYIGRLFLDDDLPWRKVMWLWY